MLSSHLRQASPRRLGRESGTDYQGPAVWKAARGTDKLYMFLSATTVVTFFVDCTNYSFQTKPKSLRFIVKIFNLSLLAALSENVFYRCPNPLSETQPRHKLSMWPHSLRFPHQNPACTSSVPHMSHMPCPSPSSWFYHPNNIWWAVQIIKLHFM
jgi:hypothetical protein